MSDLQFNKIAGALLATGLVILGVRTGAETLFHTEAPEKAGYAIEVQEETAEGAAAPEVPPDWGTALASADLTAGQTVSGKCASCHTFNQGGAVTTGPNLWNVVGSKPASRPGFDYSPAMRETAAKYSWDYEHLYEYLAAPQRYVPGTKMTFVGLKKQDERINMIAWLRAQADSPAPIPPPNPAAAAAPAEAATTAPAEGAAPAAGAGASAAGTQAPAAAPQAAATKAAPAPGH